MSTRAQAPQQERAVHRDRSHVIMQTRQQFVRYALVGLAANFVLYLAYLALTWLGMGHKTAMTLLYALGVLQTEVGPPQ